METKSEKESLASSSENYDVKTVDDKTGECSKSLDEKYEDSTLTDIVTGEEYLGNKNIILLPYEKQMFLDIIHSDCLLICGRGITYDRPLINVLKIYSDFANLVLIINSSDWEEDYYRSHLDKKFIREVSNSVTERELTYLEGGIQFISTRIFVVDLLKERVPVHLITGIVVLRAHTIIESCQEAFALRLYRQKNKTGFIKAFSQSPEAFTIGWSHVERTMRNLFVKELFLWPRFHATVQHSLKPFESQAIEFHVPMTLNMIKMQSHVLDIMNYLVKEIKRINRYVDLDEVTVENCVTKKFHKILQAQLDSIWHRLNSQTKLIIADLKVLRNIIISTIYGDSVSSYNLIKKYRTTEYALNNSGWTLLDAADNLFQISKARVYNSQGEFEPEHCPKWKTLSEILRVEIPNDSKNNSSQVKVLILCQDSKTCFQLNQFLQQGPEVCLFTTAIRYEVPITKLSDSYKKNLSSNNKEENTMMKVIASQKQKKQNLNKKNENYKEKDQEENSTIPSDVDELKQILSVEEPLEESNIFQQSYILTMTQNIEDLADESVPSIETSNLEKSIFESFPEIEILDITNAILSSSKNNQPLICIQTFKTDKEGSKGLDRVLDEFQPQYIIMYHCSVTAVRQLEFHEAKLRRKSKDRMKIFFLFHSKTIEEQSYLTSLRREKQAFELLINTKKTMIVPDYQDGKNDEAFEIIKPLDHDELDVWGLKQKGRKAGGQNTEESKVIKQPKIIVDMREFRSDLPCLIHRRGLQVVPLTITIGDYILTPEICVERKSISDLIGSLNSGRLYNQCIQMQRFYAKPILLIEFDQNKPFHLQNKFMLSGVSTVSSNADVVQRLQLLTLHFPKLRLIWSPSPYATAQLFEELKHGKEEPDNIAAAALGTDESSQFELEKFNSNIYDFMLRLPGINSKNIHKVMRNGGSLRELLKKTTDELSELCDSENDGKLLWDCLHISHLPDKDKEPIAGSNNYPSTSSNVRGKIFTKLGKSRGTSYNNKTYGNSGKRY